MQINTIVANSHTCSIHLNELAHVTSLSGRLRSPIAVIDSPVSAEVFDLDKLEDTFSGLPTITELDGELCFGSMPFLGRSFPQLTA
jgi:hypothetical protein